MDRFYKMMKRNNKGFTLVELMVVLLILGILVAIAIPIYNKTQDNAKAKACQANLRTIDGAIAQYASDQGKTIEEVASGLATNGVAQLVTDGYLKQEPICPSGSASYEIDNDGVAKCPNEISEHTYSSSGSGGGDDG